MFKKIAVAVYERVVKSYKSTLVGFAVAVGIVVLGELGQALASIDKVWAAPLAALAQLVGAFLKGKQAEYPMPPAPPAPPTE